VVGSGDPKILADRPLPLFAGQILLDVLPEFVLKIGRFLEPLLGVQLLDPTDVIQDVWVMPFWWGGYLRAEHLLFPALLWGSAVF
jgi:hypothetical protein